MAAWVVLFLYFPRWMEIGVVGCFQDNGAVEKKKNEDVIGQGQPTTVATERLFRG